MSIRRVDTAKSHYYVDEHGVRVPGVTTIMKALPKDALINWAANTTADYALNNWDALADKPPAARLKELQGSRYAEKDAAANRGTQVHAIGERLAAGEEVTVPDEIAGHAESYARFLDEFRVKPVAVEFTIFSVQHRYAGTADMIADLWDHDSGEYVRWLLDLKTNRSGIFGETALQLAGYRYADTYVIGDTEVDPIPVEKTGAVHVRGDGYSLIPVTAGRDQFRTLLYLQQIARFVESSRDLVGDPVLPPTTSSYRLVRSDAA